MIIEVHEYLGESEEASWVKCLLRWKDWGSPLVETAGTHTRLRSDSDVSHPPRTCPLLGRLWEILPLLPTSALGAVCELGVG